MTSNFPPSIVPVSKAAVPALKLAGGGTLLASLAWIIVMQLQAAQGNGAEIKTITALQGSRITILEESSKKSQNKIEAMSETVTKTATDVEVVKANQKNMATQLKDIKAIVQNPYYRRPRNPQ